MKGNAYAVLIGINNYADQQYLNPLRYAEKDCQDFYEVLTDSETGIFSPDRTTLLLGQDATTENVLSTLYQEIVNKPTAEDMVLVYFSGHGFVIGEKKQQKAYLATQDVNFLKLSMGRFRDGLRMSELYSEVFSQSAAKHVLFILDSCNSGAFISNPKSATGSTTKLSTSTELIEKGFFAGQEGRIALVSCPPNVASYETEEFKNSIFTHYLLEGLRGGAIESETGEVTIDSLLAYVRNHAPSDQLPGRYGQDYGRIVLAKARSNWREQTAKAQITSIALQKKTIDSQPLEVTPLRSLLDPFRPFIERLTELLADEQLSSNVDSRILEAVRIASDADFVVVLRQAQNSWVIRTQSGFEQQQLSQSIYAIVSEILPIISKDSVFNPDHRGSYQLYEEGNTAKALVLVPLTSEPTTDLMLVCGITSDSFLLSEVYSQILTKLYSITNQLTIVQATLIEADILDDLKRVYRFVPMAIYQRRFELFCRRLNQMITHFEPILYLDPDFLHIDSWEALARSPETGAAPIDLFQAAELWGDQFMIELDMYFIRCAVSTYRTACLNTPGKRRFEDVQELSVNVYPQSLAREAYFKAVEGIIKDKLIQPEKLILEISEKTPLPSFQTDSEEVPLESFRQKLEKYARELRIGFSIDDFGVGHSSITRLVGLTPSHVKIDREVLYQKAIDTTLRFVIDISSRSRLRIPKIVVEGFDSESPITLGQLYQTGVRYVQGYVVGKAEPELIRLERQQSDYLRKMILSDDSK